MNKQIPNAHGFARRLGRRFVPGLLAFAAGIAGFAACDGASSLETRTFDLTHLDADEAAEIVRPYVYEEREGAAGQITTFSSGISVRERPETLDRIADVLDRYDAAPTAVRLYFQLIEADGFEAEDPRLDDLREALSSLFRFQGYRLADEAQLAMIEGTVARQPMASAIRSYDLESSVRDVRAGDQGGAVTVAVHLSSGVMGDDIMTTLTVPIGETVVLGSSRRAAEPTMILTVRPELVAQ